MILQSSACNNNDKIAILLILGTCKPKSPEIASIYITIYTQVYLKYVYIYNFVNIFTFFFFALKRSFHVSSSPLPYHSRNYTDHIIIIYNVIFIHFRTTLYVSTLFYIGNVLYIIKYHVLTLKYKSLFLPRQFNIYIVDSTRDCLPAASRHRHIINNLQVIIIF